MATVKRKIKMVSGYVEVKLWYLESYCQLVLRQIRNILDGLAWSLEKDSATKEELMLLLNLSAFVEWSPLILTWVAPL